MIDNCPGDALLMRLAFRRAQFDLDFELAASGEAGLARLEDCVLQNNPLPDLVLCDLNLPRLHGLDLLALLKANPDLSGLPVVICSSSSAVVDIQGAQALGADEYITKPMGVAAYDSMVQGLMHDWLQVPIASADMPLAVNENPEVWRLPA